MGVGELLIIGVIGLLVLGPERLPVAIRTVSGWIRTVKQMANSVTAEMSHELKVHELHQNLKKAEEQGMQNLSPEIQASVDELKAAADDVTRPYQPESQRERQAQNQSDHPSSALLDKDLDKNKVKSDD